MKYRHKNNKLVYYTRNYLRQLIPSIWYRRKLSQVLDNYQLDTQALDRIDYYNKLHGTSLLNSETPTLSELKISNTSSVYYFDLYEYSRYFESSLKASCIFGDVTAIPDLPSLVKSRPIAGDNAYSILLKWNKVRHFTFVNHERKQFLDKINRLVFRGNVHECQVQRIAFLTKHISNPICNVGMVNKNNLNPDWLVNRMSIDEQLEYKFILCLEGADVASNLKWVMSSRSLAVMPRPKYETWFMEGRLIPDFHYIEIDNDYNNLNSKLSYYINHPEKALAIIENANNYVQQFQNKRREDIISLLVLKKYFEKTDQVITNL